MKFVFMFFSFLVLGCSTLSKQDCEKFSGLERGREDASKKKSFAAFDGYQKACESKGVLIEGKSYLEGYCQGLVTRPVESIDAEDVPLNCYETQKKYLTPVIKKYCTVSFAQELGSQLKEMHFSICEENKNLLKNSYLQSVKKVCTKANGEKLGLEGMNVDEERCPEELKASFLAGVAKGRSIKNYNQKLRTVNSDIKSIELKISDPATSDMQKVQLQQQLRSEKERLRELEIEKIKIDRM